MSQQSQLVPSLNFSNSLLVELLENLVGIDSTKVWLQKVVNLLKQIIRAKHIFLHTYIDNLFVYATDDLAFRKEQIFDKLSTLDKVSISRNGDSNGKPYWIDSAYIFPLSIEGTLKVVWDKIPSENELKIYNNVFLLLDNSLKNRSDLISQEQNIFRQTSLLKFEKILNNESDLKNQLSLLVKEISETLNISRCQIKIFSQTENVLFDSLISSEFVRDGFLESISVIPSNEQNWIKQLQNGELIVLDQRQNILEDNIAKDIDSLLSVQSVLGYPLLYKGKAIGVLVLHQCDYRRDWKNDEVLYLREVSLLLSLIIGKELEVNKKYYTDPTILNPKIISADEFLRELGHVQVEAQLTNSFFSLVMLDIERLNDINLKMGFIAGNLVLSQTARYLSRLFGDVYKIARYNNDEFVVIMKSVDQNKAKLETENLKEQLSNISVLGIGPVDYNFSFVTYPTHSSSIAELLTLLEQAMLLSKSRGKSQISSFDEVQGEGGDRWQELLKNAVPEIIIKKSSLKTGPEVFKNIEQQWNKQKNIYSADILDSVQSLAIALDAKDSYTEGHSQRVAEYACMLAKQLSLDLQEIEWIRLAASMHDIGKIGIPESILCKPDKLTKEEYEVMKKHPLIGARILKPIKPLEKVANLVLYHHEYWDGSGYPNGLSKTDIPIGSRIVSIVDAYQAMTSHRPYRFSLPFEEAIKRLQSGKEKQWDPELVNMFIKIVS